MPAWQNLRASYNAAVEQGTELDWLRDQILTALNTVSEQRATPNVLFYGSGSLQKPTAPGQYIQITPEDVNGYMSVLHGMEYDQTLSLILHTPGGNVNAAESLVEYLRSKFKRIEVIN